MSSSIIARIVLIGAAASAIALAPPAGAAVDPGCRVLNCSDTSPAYNPRESNDFATVPQGWANDVQFAGPEYNPFGSGPQPPLLAFD